MTRSSWTRPEFRFDTTAGSVVLHFTIEQQVFDYLWPDEAVESADIALAAGLSQQQVWSALVRLRHKRLADRVKRDGVWLWLRSRQAGTRE